MQRTYHSLHEYHRVFFEDQIDPRINAGNKIVAVEAPSHAVQIAGLCAGALADHPARSKPFGVNTYDGGLRRTAVAFYQS